MKIAVWLDTSYNPKTGGSFSYSNRLLKEIDNYNFIGDVEVCFAKLASLKKTNFQKEVISIYTPFELIASLPFIPNVVARICRRLSKMITSTLVRKQLERKGVKILYYTSQFCTPIKGFPYIASHWDIAHRSTFSFPELKYWFKQRERYYNEFVPNALMIFAESNTGKEELLKYTHTNAERIRQVPLFAGECTKFSVSEEEQLNILKEFGLHRNEYFFYPAQFIAEKNHSAILYAMTDFVKKYPSYKVVFTGNNRKNLYGNKDYIEKLAKDLGLANNIVFPGFVPLTYIYTFYKNACSLIMASYVGPTNMPPLEAMEIGCPVICTNLGGHREELEDAAIYFDAKNYKQLHNAMIEMVQNRHIYINRIKEQAKNCTFTVENALKCINDNFIDISVIRNTWG